MIEERLRSSIVNGPQAHEADETAWRIVAFLTWWRVWVGGIALYASFIGALQFAPGLGLYALPAAWFLGFLGHAVVSEALDT